MNKVLIVGGCNGIGGGVREVLLKETLNRNPDVLETNRTIDEVFIIGKSTNYDINDGITPSFDQLANNSNVIVLNAYADFTAQLRLLFDVVEQYGEEKLIIVLGSISAWRSNQRNISRCKYSVEKYAIIKAARDLNEIGYKITVINPGVVDTKWNENKDVPKLKVTDIGDAVLTAIYSYNQGIVIEEMTLTSRG